MRSWECFLSSLAMMVGDIPLKKENKTWLQIDPSWLYQLVDRTPPHLEQDVNHKHHTLSQNKHRNAHPKDKQRLPIPRIWEAQLFYQLLGHWENQTTSCFHSVGHVSPGCWNQCITIQGAAFSLQSAKDLQRLRQGPCQRDSQATMNKFAASILFGNVAQRGNLPSRGK